MKILNIALVVALVCSGSARAETPLSKQLSIELNAAQSVDSGCKLSFLIINGHEQVVDKAVYEAVLFDTNGQVDRLMLFDFGQLPASRPRVRQFVVPQMSCASLGQILVNGVNQCVGEGLPESACIHDLKLGTRTEIEVLG